MSMHNKPSFKRAACLQRCVFATAGPWLWRCSISEATWLVRGIVFLCHACTYSVEIDSIVALRGKALE